MECLLTLNAGSSSIKAAVYEVGNVFTQRFWANVERIGQPEAALRTSDNPAMLQTVTAHDHREAADVIMHWLDTHIGSSDMRAIGYRIVHGGPRFHEPTILSLDVIAELKPIATFDPEHLPAVLALIDVFSDAFPNTLHVGCFDTAFFHDLPIVAQTLPLPRKFSEQGLRRYGFHGLAYEHLMTELRQREGDTVANGRVVLAHLGGGASLAAILNGQPIDTTMGLTPASGVMMSSRSGDLDPGIASYLSKTAGVETERFNHMVNFESGLLGVSGTSADMLTLLGQEQSDPHAHEAIELFCYQVKKTIGAYAAAMGGLDSLVFSGGIGQNSPIIRERISTGLEFLGLTLDPNRNRAGEHFIAKAGTHVGAYVIPANEEVVLAEQTLRRLDGQV